MNGETIGNQQGELLGTGARLNRHIDHLLAAEGEKSPIFYPHQDIYKFNLLMARQLAGRIKAGVTPADYATATRSLVDDCAMGGTDSVSGKPLPAKIIGQLHVRYYVFELDAIGLARGAFGDEFADRVNEIYDAYVKKADI